VGPAPEDLPGLRPVRERAADAHPAGHRRPAQALRPGDLDWVIVRENSEGEYAGVGGRVHQGHPIEAATDVTMMTRAGVERIIRYAFRLAPLAAAQAADGGDQVERAAPRDGDVGRDRAARSRASSPT
jgi:hypothetical protein